MPGSVPGTGRRRFVPYMGELRAATELGYVRELRAAILRELGSDREGATMRAAWKILPFRTSCSCVAFRIGQLSKFDFFINLCYNYYRKRKEKILLIFTVQFYETKINNLLTIYSYPVHKFMI